MWQPADTAILAARILVAMPPEPTSDARAAGHAFDLGRDVQDAIDELRAGVGVRVRGVQAVHVRQQQQAVRARHLRDARGQPVVVAVADLGGRYGVVLVDDR